MGLTKIYKMHGWQIKVHSLQIGVYRVAQFAMCGLYYVTRAFCKNHFVCISLFLMIISDDTNMADHKNRIKIKSGE